MIYLDSNATTQIAPEVLEAMLPWLRDEFGNPSSDHAGGRRARRAIESAREEVALLIGAEPDEVIFTSGGTEAINSVHRFAQLQWPERRRLVYGATEHSAGIECAGRWGSLGGEAVEAPVDAAGVILADELENRIQPGSTALVSVMWANNEVGTIAPLGDVVDRAHDQGALVHTDAVQAAGKTPVNLRELRADYASFSAHKLHGTKGVGALFVRRGAPFHPLLVGGGQESGRRSGTENVAAIVGFGAAARLAHAGFPASLCANSELRDHLERLLIAAMPDAVIHAAAAPRLPNTSSIAFPGVDAAGLLILLDQRGIACSGGSACHAGQVHPSHVLKALGFDAAHARSSIRFSLSRFTTESEVRMVAAETIGAVSRLREMFDAASPVAFADG